MVRSISPSIGSVQTPDTRPVTRAPTAISTPLEAPQAAPVPTADTYASAPPVVVANVSTVKPVVGAFGRQNVTSAKMAAAAYLPSVMNWQPGPQYGKVRQDLGVHAELRKLGFTAENRDIIDGLNADHSQSVANEKPGGSHAIIAHGDSPATLGTTALIFRGTTFNGTFSDTLDLYDVGKDLTLEKVSATARYGGEGTVHKGFDQALDSSWNLKGPAILDASGNLKLDASGNVEHEPDVGIAAAIRAAVKANPNGELYFTGHSLGAAEALLAFSRAEAEGLLTGFTGTVRIDTYGQPRLGDQAFCDTLSRQLDAVSKRTGHQVILNQFINEEDPVPRMAPLSSGFGNVEPTKNQGATRGTDQALVNVIWNRRQGNVTRSVVVHDGSWQTTLTGYDLKALGQVKFHSASNYVENAVRDQRP